MLIPRLFTPTKVFSQILSFEGVKLFRESDLSIYQELPFKSIYAELNANYDLSI